MKAEIKKWLKVFAVLIVCLAVLAGCVYLLSDASWLTNQKLQIVNGVALAVCTVVQLTVKLLNQYVYREWLKKLSRIADLISLPLWLIFLAGILAA